MTDLVKLYETRVLTNVRLTQHQMEILAKVAASPEGVVPDEDISKDRNYTAARQLLTKLGLLTNDGEDKYSISETGQKVAKDENIVDETGQLTELGNKLAYKDDEDEAPPPAEPAGPMDAPAPNPFADTAGPAADIPAESFSMLKNFLFEDKQSYRVTFATQDNAPDEIPYYEPTFVRGASRSDAKVEAEKTIQPKHKKYVKVDTLRVKTR